MKTGATLLFGYRHQCLDGLSFRIQFHFAKRVKWSLVSDARDVPGRDRPPLLSTPCVAMSGDAARKSACATSAAKCEVVLARFLGLSFPVNA